jgi:predicted metal-binding membrane protein
VSRTLSSRPVQSSAAALPRPVTAAIIAALLVLAAAAWLFTAEQAASMSGMGGIAMLGAGLFLATWVVMMMAMMFPAVAPMVLTHARVVRARGEGAIPTVAFVLGYLAIWTAAGLVPLAVIQLLGSSIAAPLSGWLPRLGGAVVLLAGAYQLTPLKNACLRACRSPLGFVLSHDFGGGAPAAARGGISHGLYCLGCCWALMAVLAVLGLMNLGWMAVFAVVFFLEKNWRQGVTLSRVAGVACVVLGAAVLIRPDVLSLVGGPMS